MGLAEDLLGIADQLATPLSDELEQASLRRAVSTAYYALFHLLCREVGDLWMVDSAKSRERVKRALQHKVHTWTPVEAQSVVDEARLAFQQWQGVRGESAAREYLLSLIARQAPVATPPGLLPTGSLHDEVQ